VQGSLVYDDFSESMRVNAEGIMDMDQARNEYAQRLVLSLDASRFGNGLLEHLAEVLAPHREGRCPVWVDYRRPGAQAQIVLDQSWRIRPTEALLRDLKGLTGEHLVRLEYR
jgi:DNA polymerase-3 subunit alpha